MSKVFFALSHAMIVDGKPCISSFYDQFIQALKENGNDICIYVPSMFHKTTFYGENDLKENIDELKLKQAIIKFSPDLIISFNGSNYKNIFDCTSCPVVIWDADQYKMWNQKDFIKKNKEKYTFFSFSEYGVKEIKEAFSLKDTQIFHVKSATNLKSKPTEKTKNISFIGSYFIINSDLLCQFIKNHRGEEALFIILNEIKKNPFVSKEKILEKIKGVADDNIWQDFCAIDDKYYTFLFSGQNRIGALYTLCDMGLDLYGDEDWKNVISSFPEIGACLNKRFVYSAQDNQEIYNQSKLCLNVVHCQSKNSMPWRVADIMATSGCLISEYLPMIDEEFGKYVKIPMFETPYDVRSLAQKLLKDEQWRSDIVEGSNLVIEEKYRFTHRLRQMEEILGISLCGPAEGGCSTLLQPDYVSVEKKSDSAQKVLSLKNKLRYKVWKHLSKRTQKKRNEQKTGFVNKLRYKIWKHLSKKLEKKKIVQNALKQIKVLFLCPDKDVFCLMQLYRLMEKSTLFSPVIGVFPYEHCDESIKFDPEKLSGIISYCEENKLAYEVLYDDENHSYKPLSTVKPDLVFFNSTLALKPIASFFAEAQGLMTVFVPYGYFLSNSQDYIFNTVYNNQMSFQFWETSLSLELSKKYAANKGVNSYFLGYPKLDAFFDGHKQKKAWKEQKKTKKKIIWAPHHSIEENTEHYGYSCFCLIAEMMLKLAKKYENDIQFAFRPHPLLRERLNNDSRWGPDRTAVYYHEWENLSNGQFSASEYTDLFLQADAIIGDSISFTCEFSALNKPYLFTVRDGTISNKFNELGSDVFHNLLYKGAPDEKEIEDFISSVVLAGKDTRQKQRKDFIKRELLPPNGKSASQNIFDFLFERILK